MPLAVGVVGGLWRWRLELTLLGTLVLAQVLLGAVVGNVGAGLVVGAVVAGTLSVPASGGWLVRALRAARVRRAWWRTWTDCGLPRVPAGRVIEIPAGTMMSVRAARGSSLEAVEERRGAGGLPAGPRGPGRARC